MLLKLKRKYRKDPIIQALDCYLIIREVLMALDTVERNKEHMWVMGLSSNNIVKYIDLVSIGTLNATVADPREVFTYVIRFGGIAKIILIHNHPSGNLNPSSPDKAYTQRMIDAGKILRIEVLDHLIIGVRSYYSFLGVSHVNKESV